MRKSFWVTLAAWVCCSALLQAEVASWSQSSFLVQENAGTGSLSVVMDSASGNSVVLDYSVTNGTAIGQGLDVTLPLTGNVLIPAGNTSASINFGIIADNVIEGLESLTVTLTGTSDNSITLGATSTATLNIQDDDGSGNLEVFWAWSERTNYESDVVSSIPVYLSQPSTSTVSVNVVVTGSVNASDLGAMSSTLTFSPGTTRTYYFPAFANDTVVEPTETMILTLDSASGANVMSSMNSLMYTILDDDGTPELEVITGSGVVTEGASATVFFRLSHPASQSITFTVSDVAGTATNGADYSFTSSNLTIPAGSLEVNKNITTFRDGITEGDENFQVSISNPSNATLGSVSSSTIQIVDDKIEVYPSFGSSFYSSSSSIYEYQGTKTLYAVTLGNKTIANDIVVNYALSGTASSGDDFSIPATITIPAGSQNGFAAISLVDDHLVESTETLTITVTSAANATGIALGNESVTLNILDNDTEPTVNLSTYSSVTEGSSTQTLTRAVLDRPYSGNVTVNLAYSGNATSGLDYSLSSGNAQLLFSPNSTSYSYVYVTPVDDNLVEGNEVIVTTIASAVNAIIGSSNTVTTTLVDNDGHVQEARLLSFSGSQSIHEATSGSSSFRVYINATSGESIDYVIADVGGNATLDLDYTLSTNAVTIPAGQNYSPSISITAKSDNLNEINEAVIFGITSASNGIISSTNTVTYTIIDNNDEPLVYFGTTSKTVSESSFSSFQNIFLDQVYSGNVSAVIATSGNAVLGTDYTLSSNAVTFTSGQTSSGVYVYPINNALIDGTRDVILTLSNVINATTGSGNRTTVSILDNENPKLFITPYSTAENNSSYQVRLSLQTTSELPVYGNLEVTGGTATLGQDYILNAKTFTFTPGTSSLFIDMGLVDDDTAESSETLVFTVPQLVSASLNTLTETATIIDNDADPTVEISSISFGSSPSLTMNEGAYFNQFYIRLSQATSRDVYVNYSAMDGTATRTLDYGISANGMVRIPAGSTSVSVPIYSVDDLLDEANETATIVMGNVIGATASTSGNVLTLTINDNDEPTGPAVSFYSNSSSVLGTAGNATVFLTLNTALSTDVTFQVSVNAAGTTAIAGKDYTYSPSVSTITAGNTSTSVSVSIINDTSIEASNYITFELTSASGANVGAMNRHVLTISRANAVGESGFHAIKVPVYNQSADYRMVGFPIVNMTAVKLLTKLTAAIGIKGDYTWQLYQYEAMNNAGYKSVNASSNIQTGEGFWMASVTNIENNISVAAPLSTDIVNVDLDQGWNIVANPYLSDLSKTAMSIVTSGNTYALDGIQTETASTLWTYNGISGNATYSSSANLASGEAAWLYVWSGNSVSLRMTPISNTTNPGMTKTQRSAPRQEPYPPSPPSSPAPSTSASGGGCLLKAADQQEVNR